MNRRRFLAGLASASALPLLAPDGARAAPSPSTAGYTPMLRLRKSDERGRFDHGWLDTRHSFSFASYYDPRHMGFRALRVINEDRIAPMGGFPTHPHRDMVEIVTYVVEGALEHKDSMGNGSVIRAGDVQRMSAGTGITHSEFNPSAADAVHLLQIWLLPTRTGTKPSYAQASFPDDAKRDTLRLVASPDGADGSVSFGTDVRLFAGMLAAGAGVEHAVAPGRHAWMQVVRGRLRVNGVDLAAGDGLAASDEGSLLVQAVEPAHVLLFDLA